MDYWAGQLGAGPEQDQNRSRTVLLIISISNLYLRVQPIQSYLTRISCLAVSNCTALWVKWAPQIWQLRSTCGIKKDYKSGVWFFLFFFFFKLSNVRMYWRDAFNTLIMRIWQTNPIIFVKLMLQLHHVRRLRAAADDYCLYRLIKGNLFF